MAASLKHYVIPSTGVPDQSKPSSPFDDLASDIATCLFSTKASENRRSCFSQEFATFSDALNIFSAEVCPLKGSSRFLSPHKPPVVFLTIVDQSVRLLINNDSESILSLSGQPEFQANIPRAAAFAVAGPVADNRCDMTNLSWTIDGNYLTEKHGVRPVHSSPTYSKHPVIADATENLAFPLPLRTLLPYLALL